MGQISADTTTYLIRHALVTTYTEATEKAQVMRLSEVPPHLFGAIVSLYAERRREEEAQEAERKQRVQRELSAYYTGKVASMRQEAGTSKAESQQDEQLKEALLEDVTGADKEKSAATLFLNEKALLTPLTVSFCFGKLEQQASSAWHAERFRKFRTLKAMYRAERLQHLNAKKAQLTALKDVLERVLAAGTAVRLTQDKIKQLQETCLRCIRFPGGEDRRVLQSTS